MAKNKDVIEVSINGKKLKNGLKSIKDLIQKEKEIQIKSAILKEDFCNYSYELKTGVTAGDELSRAGASIVHDDLKEKFAQLNVHLAFLDNAYVLSKETINDIDDCHGDDIASTYFATGFKLTGSGENEAVVLTGHKHVNYGSIDVKTPKLEFQSSYPFSNELRVAIDDCIDEVDAYMHGKTAPKMVQQEMPFDNADKVEGEE